MRVKWPVERGPTAGLLRRAGFLALLVGAHTGPGQVSAQTVEQFETCYYQLNSVVAALHLIEAELDLETDDLQRSVIDISEKLVLAADLLFPDHVPDARQSRRRSLETTEDFMGLAMTLSAEEQVQLMRRTTDACVAMMRETLEKAAE